jgi:hypothetical protein
MGGKHSMHGANKTHKPFHQKHEGGKALVTSLPSPRYTLMGYRVVCGRIILKRIPKTFFENELYSTSYVCDHLWALVNPAMK